MQVFTWTENRVCVLFVGLTSWNGTKGITLRQAGTKHLGVQIAEHQDVTDFQT